MATNNSTTTLPEYYALLEAHDWFYEHSDDHRTWKKGTENAQKLASIAGQSDEHNALYEAHCCYIRNSGAVKPVLRENRDSGSLRAFNYRT